MKSFLQLEVYLYSWYAYLHKTLSLIHIYVSSCSLLNMFNLAKEIV